MIGLPDVIGLFGFTSEEKVVVYLSAADNSIGTKTR
jgi:hypothetical protein